MNKITGNEYIDILKKYSDIITGMTGLELFIFHMNFIVERAYKNKRINWFKYRRYKKVLKRILAYGDSK